MQLREEVAEALTPHEPVVSGVNLNEAVRKACTRHAAVETVTAGIEEVGCADIDAVVLCAVLRQLVFVQHGREQSDVVNTVVTQVSHVRRHTSAVAESGYNATGQDAACGVDHRDQIAQRVLDLVFVAEFAVVCEALPSVAAVERSLLDRPLVAVRHNEYERLTPTGGDHGIECVDSTAQILPRALIAVDAMDEIQYRQWSMLISLRHVDIYVSEDMLRMAIPRRVRDFRRYACRVARLGA